MKKSTNKTLQQRKLILRRQTVVLLTPPQLEDVAGGDDPQCSKFEPRSCPTESALITN
jgi:hypothetical protein